MCNKARASAEDRPISPSTQAAARAATRKGKRKASASATAPADAPPKPKTGPGSGMGRKPGQRVTTEAEKAKIRESVMGYTHTEEAKR